MRNRRTYKTPYPPLKGNHKLKCLMSNVALIGVIQIYKVQEKCGSMILA